VFEKVGFGYYYKKREGKSCKRSFTEKCREFFEDLKGRAKNSYYRLMERFITGEHD
jgi:hypothetical protein